MSDFGSLPTRLWFDAHLRRLSERGTPYTIAHKGDAQRGTLALKLLLGREKGCRVLVQTRSPEGEAGWMPALEGRTVPESEADAYLSRLTDRDPDVWVIEIESRDGTHPFEGQTL